MMWTTTPEDLVPVALAGLFCYFTWVTSICCIIFLVCDTLCDVCGWWTIYIFSMNSIHGYYPGSSYLNAIFITYMMTPPPKKIVLVSILHCYLSTIKS